MRSVTGFALGLSGQTEHVIVTNGDRDFAACKLPSRKLQETEGWSRNGVNNLCKRCLAYCATNEIEVPRD